MNHVGHSHRLESPMMTEEMLRLARIAKALFKPVPFDPCEDDPDPDYGL